VGGGVLCSDLLEVNFSVFATNFAASGAAITHPTNTEPILNRTKFIRNVSTDGNQISEF
jgi:hypothetical protein